VDEEIAARGRRAARLSDEYHRAWRRRRRPGRRPVGASARPGGRGRGGASAAVRGFRGAHHKRGWHVRELQPDGVGRGAITIGADCQIGGGAAAHPDPPGGAGAATGEGESAEPITLGDNVWLGGGVIVCRGEHRRRHGGGRRRGGGARPARRRGGGGQPGKGGEAGLGRRGGARVMGQRNRSRDVHGHRDARDPAREWLLRCQDVPPLEGEDHSSGVAGTPTEPMLMTSSALTAGSPSS